MGTELLMKGMIMIEEEHVRFVAQATVTDDCRVEVELRRRRMPLTTVQALELAEEIVKAVGEATVALVELLHPVEPAGFDLIPVVGASMQCLAQMHDDCDLKRCVCWCHPVTDEAAERAA